MKEQKLVDILRQNKHDINVDEILKDNLNSI